MATSSLGTGGDYTTINAWEADKQGVLAELQTGECKAENFAEATYFDGSTTTSSFYFHLTSQSGAEHDGRANLVSSAGNARVTYAGDTLIGIDGFMRVSWMEFFNQGTGTNYGLFLGLVGSLSTFYVHHCIVHNDGYDSAGFGVYSYDANATLRCYRNIIYGRFEHGIATSAAGTTGDYYFNTIYDVDSNGIQMAASTTCTIKYNAIYDCGGSDIANTAGTLDYNFTSDAYDVGKNGANGEGGKTASNDLVNPTATWANTDLLIKEGGDLIDEGVDESAQGWPDIDKSIDDRSTSISGTWDIGASQIASGTSIPVFMHYYTKTLKA